MSQESFAAVSVATAVICGVFFYPPPPESRTQPAPAVAAAPAASVASAAIRPRAMAIQAAQPKSMQATIQRAGLLTVPQQLAPAPAETKGNAT